MEGPGLHGGSGDAAGPKVEDSQGAYCASASGAGAAVHELAGQPVAAGQGGVAQHADGAAAHRGGIESAGLGEESPGTGHRCAGAHSLRPSAARHWLTTAGIPLNVVSQWLGHATPEVTLRIYLPIVGSTHSMADVP